MDIKVVYLEQPPPSAFFTCQKVTIIGVNIVLGVLFLAMLATSISPSGVRFAVPLLISPFFLGYFYCGIYGALREKECEFLVHLLIPLLSTFVSIVGAALILFAGIDSLESSRRRLTGRMWKFENGGGGDRHLQEIVKVVAYVVFCIVWNAFLVVFARNLHQRKRQQKVG